MEVTMEIDTGASISIINYNTYLKLSRKFKIFVNCIECYVTYVFRKCKRQVWRYFWNSLITLRISWILWWYSALLGLNSLMALVGHEFSDNTRYHLQWIPTSFSRLMLSLLLFPYLNTSLNFCKDFTVKYSIYAVWLHWEIVSVNVLLEKFQKRS